MRTNVFRIILPGLLAYGLLFCCNAAQADNFVEILDRAKRGDYNAQSYIGHCHLTGKGVVRDEREARYWYQQVINHPGADAKIIGHANLILGFMYFGGRGGEQNYETALKCFQSAAEQGYTDAHISIGLLYAKGLGVQRDYYRALFWWQRAADGGHPSALTYINNLRRLLTREQG